MRILALFSDSTSDGLSIDQRLAQQILKLATNRARQIYPQFSSIELKVISDSSECSDSNSIPNQVIELFYSGWLRSCASQDADCNASTNTQLNGASSDRAQESNWFPAAHAPEKPPVSAFDTILGPSCDYLVDQVARMAAYWKIPIYSASSVNSVFARKDIYTTLTRFSPSIEHMSLFILRTLELFRWRHLAIIVDKSSSLNRLQLDDLERTITRWRPLIPIERKIIALDDVTSGEKARISQSNETVDLCDARVEESLLQAKRVARVFLLLLKDANFLRKTLICAYKLGMNNGEFTFLTSDLGFKSTASVTNVDSQRDGKQKQARNPIDWYSSSDEQNNLLAREMFESLMIFSTELPVGDEFELFAEQVLELVHQEYPQSSFNHHHLNAFVVGLHDSLLVSVGAHLKATSSANSSDSELALPWAQHLSKGLLANVHINSNGDQELDYLLNDLEPELGVMRPVARYSRETRKVQMLPSSYIHWPRRLGLSTEATGKRQLLDNEDPPPDEPECGFNGDAEHCIDRQNMQAALSVAMILLVILGLFAAYVVHRSRQIRYKMQLNDYWWKIDWIQLQFIQHGESVSSKPQSIARALASGNSIISASSDNGSSYIKLNTRGLRVSSAANEESTSRTGSRATSISSHTLIPSIKRREALPLIITSVADQADQMTKKSAVSAGSASFAPSCIIRSEFSSVVRVSNLALYKNQLVIVKQLNADTIKITHELLVEIHSIRELVHENLAQFIGLCVEPGHVALVYEYCSRGSLQEMLLNKSTTMDWILKYSILGDILNGLNFIHTTKLDFHGRLKSTNLVIDSRFTVKITDFGLQNLYNQIEAISECGTDDDGSEDQRQDEGPGADLASIASAHRRQARGKKQLDQLSVSGASAFNMESVSMCDAPTAPGSAKLGSGVKIRLRNKGAARLLWTAPEHLRSDDVHSGSKRGDIYSLAIIMFELFTRRQPYHYGTNAKPNWSNIKLDRASSGSQAHNQADPAPSSTGNSSNRLGKQQRRRRHGNSTVEPMSEQDRVGDSTSIVSSLTTPGRKVRPSIGCIELISEQPEQAGTETEPSCVGEKQKVEDILDQLRMGLQPEPVRPYLPNYISQTIDSRLVDLMHSCWSENPSSRPSLGHLRSSLKSITKGMTAKNYLDNLLERLQNYASELERVVDMKSADIVDEKARTEEILFQLVPRFVADRLKRNEPIVPRLFEGVTIFFSDIVGFEKYASLMSPSELVGLLNTVYSSFDSIISSFDVTKIETIIDQFLVAAGISTFLQDGELITEDKSQVNLDQQTVTRRFKKKLPLLGRSSQEQSVSIDENPAVEDATDKKHPDETGVGNYRRGCAEQIARMALCIRDLVKSAPFRQNLSGKEQRSLIASSFNIRIGIHSGKVCAGIVGLKRPKFCLIGDTVNVASRMHTNSKANRIQISSSTKQLIETMPGFSIEPRGRIEVKGKGVMETYWLESSY